MQFVTSHCTGADQDEDEMPPLKAPAAAAPSVPSPARAEGRPLVEGSKVRVDGLTGAKHLQRPRMPCFGTPGEDMASQAYPQPQERQHRHACRQGTELKRAALFEVNCDVGLRDATAAHRRPAETPEVLCQEL